jgi:N-acyl-L-homoserine lactone synthetase
MPELCEIEHPVGADIWEWTRFCVERGRREKGRAVCPITNMLLTAVVEWGMECGVSKLIVETNPTWLLRMVQLHFRLMQLGLPRTMEGQDIIAVTISFDSRTFARLQEMRGTKKKITFDNTAHSLALLPALSNPWMRLALRQALEHRRLARTRNQSHDLVNIANCNFRKNMHF